MTLKFTPLNSDWVVAIRSGGPDAYGQKAERSISDGSGNPCRHCLKQVPKGAGMLILAARPFPDPQPYAETGPIFLCEGPCPAFDGQGAPDIMGTSATYLLKGYCKDNRIVYGTGQITDREDVMTYATALLKNPSVAYVDVRSATNNCFLTRISETQ